MLLNMLSQVVAKHLSLNSLIYCNRLYPCVYHILCYKCTCLFGISVEQYQENQENVVLL